MVCDLHCTCTFRPRRATPRGGHSISEGGAEAFWRSRSRPSGLPLAWVLAWVSPTVAPVSPDPPGTDWEGATSHVAAAVTRKD